MDIFRMGTFENRQRPGQSVMAEFEGNFQMASTLRDLSPDESGAQLQNCWPSS